MSDTLSDLHNEEPPDTARFALAKMRDSGTPSEQTFAKALSKLLETQSQQVGASRVWKILGVLGFSIATTIASYAASVASTAASDHQRLERVIEDTNTDRARAERRDDAVNGHLDELVRTTTRIETIVQRLEAAETRRSDSESTTRRRSP